MMEKRFRAFTFLVVCTTLCVARVKPTDSGCLVKTIPNHKFMVNRNCRLITGVRMNLCIGACLSYDKYPIGFEGESCSCCQPIAFRKIRRNGTMVCRTRGTRAGRPRMRLRIGTFRVHEPVKCECKPCSSLT